LNRGEANVAASAAVLVIDLQVGMFDGLQCPPLVDGESLLGRAGAVVTWARAKGLPLAFVRHDGDTADALAPGAPGWSVHPRLGQAEGEPTFSKAVGDAFSEPALEAWLRAHGAKRVILLGAQTDQCIKATLTGALQRGFETVVVADAHGTCDFAGETARQIVERHNALFARAGAKLTTTTDLIGA